MQTPNYGSDPTSPHTTFVQADPSNFRSIVQKLTGASDDPSAPKLPLTLPSRPIQKPSSSSSFSSAAAAAAAETGPRKTPFKLHERRHRKLDQIQLSYPNRVISFLSSPSSAYCFPTAQSPSSTSPSHFIGQRVCGSSSGEMVSPVSPLDLFTRMSPAGSSPQQQPPPLSPSEQEERAIAGKGFYLHPSTPRAAEPELLPLFPLHSPRDDHDSRS